MKIKTSEATPLQLDWLVAKCDGRRIGFNPGGGLEVRGRTEDGAELPEAWDLWMPWYPSTDWEHGGPIIERDGLSIIYWGESSKFGQHEKQAHFWECRHPSHRTKSRRTVGYGPTPLIAAMRCYVASKLGDEVEIPEELV